MLFMFPLMLGGDGPGGPGCQILKFRVRGRKQAGVLYHIISQIPRAYGRISNAALPTFTTAGATNPLESFE